MAIPASIAAAAFDTISRITAGVKINRPLDVWNTQLSGDRNTLNGVSHIEAAEPVHFPDI